MSFINKELLIQRATKLNSNIEVARKYYNSIYNLIFNMPEADVEEIKHGHWYFVIKNQDEARGQCSKCGKMSPLRTSRDSWGIWNIDMPRCPVCGAIMDGEIHYR